MRMTEQRSPTLYLAATDPHRTTPTSGPAGPVHAHRGDDRAAPAGRVPADAFTGPPCRSDELARALRRRSGRRQAAVTAAVRPRAAPRSSSVDAATRLVRVRGSAGALGALFGTPLRRRPSRCRGRGAAPVSCRAGGAGRARWSRVLGLDDRPQARAGCCRAPRPGRRQLHAGAARHGLRPARRRRHGPDARDHRARRRVRRRPTSTPTSAASAWPTPTVTAVGVDGAANVARPGPERRRRRGAARHRGRRRDRPGAASSSTSRRTPTPASSTRSPRPPTPRRPRPRSASAGGRARTSGPPRPAPRMDPAFADAAVLGRDRHRRRRRQRQRRQRQPPAAAARRLPGLQPARAGLRRHEPAARRRPARSRARRSGTAASQRRRDRRRRQRRVPAAGLAGRTPGVPTAAGRRRPPGAACPTSPATPTRRPATRCSSTAPTTVIGGTSAVAPLWAALVCRLAQALGTPGSGCCSRRSTPGRARPGRPRRVPRHHHGQQRRLLGRRRAGTRAPASACPTAPALLEVLRGS